MTYEEFMVFFNLMEHQETLKNYLTSITDDDITNLKITLAQNLDVNDIIKQL